MVVMEAAQSKRGMRKGSEGLKSIGRSLGFRVSRAVFPEDLKVSERKIFDPQDKSSLLWNKFFLISCILTVSVDPLFFYLPVINDQLHCLDAFYLIHMALQFCTAFVGVFGRGELVIDSAQIAKRYFIIDFMSVLPLPQRLTSVGHWIDPKSGSNLPSSTRTVKALTEVEAFALTADELKFVASQFRRLHSHTFPFYSQQWRTWAACFIQAAWCRYSKRKIMKLRQIKRKKNLMTQEELRTMPVAVHTALVLPC